MAMVKAQDRDRWLALWAADGCVEDPVGPSWLDPTGAGHRGREAIGAFFDTTIATLEGIRFEITDSFAAGSEVANVGTITCRCRAGPPDAARASSSTGSTTRDDWSRCAPSGRSTG
jgi:ketosteroid isomerase-like protein